MKTDVLIVGGGPSGLAAAYEVASRGYKVTIVDESWELGGNLRHQTQSIDVMPTMLSGLNGFEIVENLLNNLQKFSIEYLLQHEVIGFYADGSIGLANGQEIKKITPKSIIVATGAAESAVPFPGWTFPGVMTIGAAQVLINREHIKPGEKTIVIGSSDMALEIAKQIHDVGIQVIGVVESTDKMSAHNEKAVRRFQQTGIPVYLQTEVVSATGRERVSEVLLRSAKLQNSDKKYLVDFVCIDGGREPIIELLSILNCQLTQQKNLGGSLPYYTSDFQTSVSGVFVAGQAAGITCHAGIFITGAIAGISAVDYLENVITEERKSSRKLYWDELERIEAEKLPEVWQTRLLHIKSFSDTGRNIIRKAMD